jgi:hypothetical protein
MVFIDSSCPMFRPIGRGAYWLRISNERILPTLTFLNPTSRVSDLKGSDYPRVSLSLIDSLRIPIANTEDKDNLTDCDCREDRWRWVWKIDDRWATKYHSARYTSSGMNEWMNECLGLVRNSVSVHSTQLTRAKLFLLSSDSNVAVAVVVVKGRRHRIMYIQ